MINVTIKGAESLVRELKTEEEREKKALATAIRVEGFRLMKTLKREIRQGAPGGSRFKPLAKIASSRRRGRSRRSSKALQKAAMAVRYFVPSREPFEMRIGWVGPQVSKSWKRLMAIQQEGFTREITGKQRRFFRHRGAELRERDPSRKYFFLRKRTRTFKTPARPVMDPFWAAYHDEAWRNIRRNFRRKLRGERI